MTDEPVRVLIVDDHPMFRGGLRAILSEDAAVEVVGEAGDGTTATTLADELQPDVILMDLHLPDVNGIEATRAIVAESPHIAVIVITMFDDDSSVFAAMRAGARGYLLKGAAGQEILRAVHAAGHGEAIFGPSVARRMIDYFAETRSEPARTSGFPELTRRELEVLDRIAAGRNNQLIAHEFRLSPKTVRNHISNIFAKLQVADRAQAIVRAREAGLGISQDGTNRPAPRLP